MAFIIDQKNCSCCHRCRVECPAGAITFRNDKYWIDPEKCVDCGHCITVCHNACISDPANPAPKPVPHDKIKKSCDVCVIGGGASGLSAAARAATRGKKVILLEKNFEIGGSAWYASGFTVQYSDWHAEDGVEDTREQTWKRVMKKTEGKIDGELLHSLLEANVDFIDWLIEDHDLGKDYEYNPGGNGPMAIKTKFKYDKQASRIDSAIGPGSGGWFMSLKLRDILLENGGEIICSCSGKKLLTDESGAVCGVLANDGGGDIEISCKAAVVAAGAFTRNKELMDKFQPLFYDDEGKEPVHIFTHPGCTGDGITMCDELGADIDYVNRRVNMFGPMRHPYPGVTTNMGFGKMFRATGEPYKWDMSGGMQEVSDLAYDPKRMVWSVTDDQNAEASIESKMSQGPDQFGIDLTPFLKNWREVIKEEAEGGSVVIADSLEELAEKLGFDKEKFVAEIKSYNDSLASGKGGGDMDLFAMMGAPDNDDYSDMECKPFSGPKPKPKAPQMPFPGGEFNFPEGFKPPEGMPAPVGDFKMPEGFKPPEGMPAGMPGGAPKADTKKKDSFLPPMGGRAAPKPIAKAPFYALKMKIFHEDAVGGMTIDKNASVLKNGQPIPGLYAAGDNTRGIMLPGSIGVQLIEGTLTALTYALNSGYLAGDKAAGYVR